MTTYRNPSLFHQYRFSLHAQALLQVAFLSAHMLFLYARKIDIFMAVSPLLPLRSLADLPFAHLAYTSALHF